MDLIPSLAFTALLDLHPTYARMEVGSAEATALMTGMIAEMREARAQQHPDLWEVASAWISAQPTA